METKYKNCSSCNLSIPEEEYNLYGGFCLNCTKKVVSQHQALLLDFLKFIESQLPNNNIRKLIVYYSDLQICINEFLKVDRFSLNNKVYDKNNSTNDLFLKNILAKALPELSENIIYALWNSFLKTGLYYGEPHYFCVERACSRCRGEVVCADTKDYNDYVRIKQDRNIICGRCKEWIEVLNDLRRKYGWNPKWRQALADYEQFGIDNHCKLDPKDLYNILVYYDIVMTEEFQNYWNSLYARHKCVWMVKLYAIPNGIRGNIAQSAGKVLDDVATFFGFKW